MFSVGSPVDVPRDKAAQRLVGAALQGPSKDETKAARKENKKAVKEQAREKRKEKMPKHLKKKKCAAGKHK